MLDIPVRIQRLHHFRQGRDLLPGGLVRIHRRQGVVDRLRRLETGLLEASDAISMNRDRLLHDAKMQAVRLGAAGYLPPLRRTDIPAPGSSVFATLKLTVYLMREAEYISEHDARIATHLARILTGGDINPGTPLTEQHLLDLEREAFLSLCGETKTAERIEFMLKTGKPLRN